MPIDQQEGAVDHPTRSLSGGVPPSAFCLAPLWRGAWRESKKKGRVINPAQSLNQVGTISIADDFSEFAVTKTSPRPSAPQFDGAGPGNDLDRFVIRIPHECPTRRVAGREEFRF